MCQARKGQIAALLPEIVRARLFNPVVLLFVTMNNASHQEPICDQPGGGRKPGAAYIVCNTGAQMSARDGKDSPGFKQCTACAARWSTRDEFLSDPAVTLVGYQMFETELALGMLLFDHQPCGTTLALKVAAFADLYDGPIFSARLQKSPACPSHCFEVSNLDDCETECCGNWVRVVLQKVQRWPAL